MRELTELTHPALRLGGIASRSLRFLIHRCQRTLVAIPGHGVPILRHLLPLAVRSKGVLDALLTLSDRLRLSDALMRENSVRSGSNGLLHTSQPRMLDSYQEALSTLQTSLLAIQSGLRDAEEAVAMSIILLIFGFPGDRIWSVHLNGLIALIQDPDIPALASPALSLLASNFAAHVDIKAFSLGRSEASQRLWLNWRIHPLEHILDRQAAREPLSEFEISTGYPPSLVTLIALVSAVVEDVQADRPLDSAIDDYLQDVANNLRRPPGRLNNVDASPSASESPCDPHTDTILRTELVVSQWRLPDHVSSLAVKTSLALATAWAVIQKAAFIYLWRQGFGADIRAALSSEQRERVGQYLCEALSGIEAVMQAAEKHDIMVANALLWPLTVLGNECSWYPNLQSKVLEYFQRLNKHFPIHHSQIVAVLLQRLWKLTEEHNGDPDAIPSRCLSLQYMALQDGACIPLL
ncbi:fungal-specific transcription factor domain-containing protein [Aspergillus terricola var. indicus]